MFKGLFSSCDHRDRTGFLLVLSFPTMTCKQVGLQENMASGEHLLICSWNDFIDNLYSKESMYAVQSNLEIADSLIP